MLEAMVAVSQLKSLSEVELSVSDSDLVLGPYALKLH